MKIVTVPCSFDNFSYLAICEESGECAVIDPTESYPLKQQIKASGTQLTSIFCTHHHQDHIGGLDDLLAEYGPTSVYCHTSDVSRVPGANQPVSDGSGVSFGAVKGRVLYTPGHTSGSVCYLFGEHLFAGDTVFGAGCGRLFEGTPVQMYTSLNEVIGKLEENTSIYFGHEYTRTNLNFASMVESQNSNIQARLAELNEASKPSSPSTLLLEKLTNPFFRADSADIRRNLKAKGLPATASDVEVFTLLRQLRNEF